MLWSSLDQEIIVTSIIILKYKISRAFASLLINLEPILMDQNLNWIFTMGAKINFGILGQLDLKWF